MKIMYFVYRIMCINYNFNPNAHVIEKDLFLSSTVWSMSSSRPTSANEAGESQRASVTISSPTVIDVSTAVSNSSRPLSTASSYIYKSTSFRQPTPGNASAAKSSATAAGGTTSFSTFLGSDNPRNRRLEALMDKYKPYSATGNRETENGSAKPVQQNGGSAPTSQPSHLHPTPPPVIPASQTAMKSGPQQTSTPVASKEKEPPVVPKKPSDSPPAPPPNSTGRKNPEPPPKPTVVSKPRVITHEVGLAHFPNQVYRRAVKQGFEFTLMVVGESCLGKSTLINSLFLTEIYSKDYPGPTRRMTDTVKVESTRVILKEKGVQVKLTLVDCPGFGDQVDNTGTWNGISDYIEERYEEYLRRESQVNRDVSERPPDTRVHCCLYFLPGLGERGLRPLDVALMRKLHDKVNLVPVIAKADTLTPEEITLNKDAVSGKFDK